MPRKIISTQDNPVPSLGSEETRKFMASHFGIPFEDCITHFSGSAYDTAIVKTKKSAKAISNKVEGRTANGGMLHGMPLGSITDIGNYFRVTC